MSPDKRIRVLVTGGRDYDDRIKVYSVMDKLLDTYPKDHLLIVHGGANGADSLAADWAKSRAVWSASCPADWKLIGRSAGPIRNVEMFDAWAPDIVIAFPGGRGTAHMCSYVRDRGHEDRIVRIE